MGKNKKTAPLPEQSRKAGGGFIIAGIVVACIGLFVIIVELLNRAEFGPMATGSSAVVFGLLLMVVGYVKQAATAAMESYLLQKRIYEEQQNINA